MKKPDEQAGDTMAMWLPESSEKHVAQLAAARIGMVVAEVDPSLVSAEAVEKILEESGAAVSSGSIYFSDRIVLEMLKCWPCRCSPGCCEGERNILYFLE